MLEEVEKAFKALREALEIGAEYAQQALTEFDNQYRRHPSTEDRRQVIAEGHERIKAQLAYVADLLGALKWVGPVRRSTLFKLGERLSSMLDDDQWNNIEPMLMSLSAACLEKDITQGEWHLARGALSRIAYCDTTQFEPNVAQRFREIAIASLKGMRPWPFDRGEDDIEEVGSVDVAACEEGNITPGRRETVEGWANRPGESRALTKGQEAVWQQGYTSGYNDGVQDGARTERESGTRGEDKPHA